MVGWSTTPPSQPTTRKTQTSPSDGGPHQWCHGLQHPVQTVVPLKWRLPKGSYHPLRSHQIPSKTVHLGHRGKFWDRFCTLSTTGSIRRIWLQSLLGSAKSKARPRSYRKDTKTAFERWYWATCHGCQLWTFGPSRGREIKPHFVLCHCQQRWGRHPDGWRKPRQSISHKYLWAKTSDWCFSAASYPSNRQHKLGSSSGVASQRTPTDQGIFQRIFDRVAPTRWRGGTTKDIK